jgi:hypothetical protein
MERPSGVSSAKEADGEIAITSSGLTFLPQHSANWRFPCFVKNTLAEVERSMSSAHSASAKRSNTNGTLMFKHGAMIARAKGCAVINYAILLEDLHGRDLTTVKEPRVSAIHMARAGILRGAIGTIMAAVDRPGRDRASLGQVLAMLEA